MTPADVIALFATPEDLLRRCYLHIFGGATRSPSLPHMPLPPPNGQAVIATFKISFSDDKAVRGFTSGISGLFGVRKERPFVNIMKQSGPAKAVLAADEMNAYLPMVQTSDVAGGTSHYTLPTLGMPDIMLTSKLSGCRFGVGSDAVGACLVSHVQPNLAIPGVTRQTDLTTHLTGGFTNVDGSFGKGGAYDDTASVIGKRTGTRWRFYCQASSYNGQHQIDSTTRIG